MSLKSVLANGSICVTLVGGAGCPVSKRLAFGSPPGPLTSVLRERHTSRASTAAPVRFLDPKDERVEKT